MKTVIGILMVFLVAASCAGGEVRVSGGSVREIIENLQRSMVRESWAEDAASCFTYINLDELTRSAKFNKLRETLRASPAFMAAVEKVRGMPPAERQAFLKDSRRPLRPTWAQIGEISRRGTTEAGQRAESLISNRVVDLVEEMLRSNPGAGGEI